MNPENTNFIVRAFQEGGAMMFVIAFFAFATIIIVVERLLALQKLIVDKKDFSDQLYRMVISGDLKQAISYCDSRPSPLSTTIKSGLVQALNKRPDEEIQVAMDAAVMREVPKLEGWTPFLAVFGNIAVLAGLLGTIIGMIISFRAVENANDSKKAELLSQGISHALNCTAFGLLVAITAIVTYGWFQHRIQRAENEMIEGSMTLMNLIASNREKMKD